jgi:hypothetical protein
MVFLFWLIECFNCFFGMILIGFIHPRSLSCMIVFSFNQKYSYSHFHNYLDLRVVFISKFDSLLMRSNGSFNSCFCLGLETSQETNFKSETYERLVEILDFSRILKFIHHNVFFLTIWMSWHMDDWEAWYGVGKFFSKVTR